MSLTALYDKVDRTEPEVRGRNGGPRWRASMAGLIERLLQLARRIDPKRVAAAKRGLKAKTAKGYVDGRTARSHVATARVMAKAKVAP